MTEKEQLNLNLDDPDAIAGIITKTADVSPLEVTDKDLEKINKYTLSPVTTDDVFIFKASIADNEQDDRNYMPFNLKALKDMQKLYPGTTMLKDHSRRADNQIARVFDTELVTDTTKSTELGEPHSELIAKVYMIKTESNKDLIAEIKGGIKKEVSTSTKPDKMICNICGTDNMKSYCRHYPSWTYTVEDGSPNGSRKKCKMLLDGTKETFELSFVAVPSQPRAGTQKCVGFSKPCKEVEEITEIKENNNVEVDSRILAQRVKNAESFFNAENKED